MSARTRNLSTLAPNVDDISETKFRYDVSGWKVFGLIIVLALIVGALLWFFRPDFVRTRTPLGVPTEQIDMWRLVFASLVSALALMGILFWIKAIKH